jgi:hypothetical protein
VKLEKVNTFLNRMRIIFLRADTGREGPLIRLKKLWEGAQLESEFRSASVERSRGQKQKNSN